MNDLRAIFDRLEYKSTKLDSYFPVYETLFAPYVGEKVTIVEIGVLNGGSLFLWRKFLGDQARIIGIDVNPVAREISKSGFEIFIGDQSSPAFWESFFKEVGPVDILIDDGGHTNKQQIVTLISIVEHVNDGGLIVVEDTHASYLPDFGNPSRYSFVSFSKKLIDLINSRFSGIEKSDVHNWAKIIYSAEFFSSMLCLKINRALCVRNAVLESGGKEIGAVDMRGREKQLAGSFAGRMRKALPESSARRVVAGAYRTLQNLYRSVLFWNENRKLSQYFRKLD